MIAGPGPAEDSIMRGRNLLLGLSLVGVSGCAMEPIEASEMALAAGADDDDVVYTYHYLEPTTCTSSEALKLGPTAAWQSLLNQMDAESQTVRNDATRLLIAEIGTRAEPMPVPRAQIAEYWKTLYRTKYVAWCAFGALTVEQQYRLREGVVYGLGKPIMTPDDTNMPSGNHHCWVDCVNGGHFVIVGDQGNVIGDEEAFGVCGGDVQRLFNCGPDEPITITIE